MPSSLQDLIRLVDWSETDKAALAEIHPVISAHAEALVREYTDWLLGYDLTAAFFRSFDSAKHEERYRRLTEWVRNLCCKPPDDDYARWAENAAELHARNNVSAGLVALAMNWLYRRMEDMVLAHRKGHSPEKSLAALSKLLGITLALMLNRYEERREETIAAQARAILELSTPVVEVQPGVLILPLIGTIDTQRAQQIMENLLGRIVETSATTVLLDLTGVPMVDTEVANHLIRTAQAARLLGARPVLTGIRPEIAQTLVHLGVDLGSIETCGSLKDFLGRAGGAA